MNVKIIKQAINNEIQWCKDNKNQKDNNITLEQSEWFIKGLEQAKLLIDKVCKINS